MNKATRKSDGLTYWQRQSPLGKAIISACVCIPFFVAAIGFLFSKIVASEIGLALGLIFGVFYGLAFAVMVEKGIAQSDHDTNEIRNITANKFLSTVWCRVLFMWLVGFMCGYGAATWGYPWLYNSAFGSPSERLEIVSGFHSGSMRTCSHVEIERSSFLNSPRSLCMGRSMTGQISVGSTLRLVGRSSVLGMNVEHIYILAMRPDKSLERMRGR